MGAVNGYGGTSDVDPVGGGLLTEQDFRVAHATKTKLRLRSVGSTERLVPPHSVTAKAGGLLGATLECAELHGTMAR